MKRGFIVIFLSCSLVSVYGQSVSYDSIARNNPDSIRTDVSATSHDSVLATPISKPFDRIITVSNDSLTVTVKDIEAGKVTFVYPFNYVVNSLPTNQVREIQLKNGETREFSTTTVTKEATDNNQSIPPEDNWRIIKVLTSNSEVAGLTDLGEITARAEAERMNTSTQILEKNALLTLRKKAAHMGATQIIVIDKNVQQAYGDLPYVELKARAYGSISSYNSK